MLLRSGAVKAGGQQEYSPEMLAAEISGISQGSRGFDGARKGGDASQQARPPAEEVRKHYYLFVETPLRQRVYSHLYGA